MRDYNGVYLPNSAKGHRFGQPRRSRKVWQMSSGLALHLFTYTQKSTRNENKHRGRRRKKHFLSFFFFFFLFLCAFVSRNLKSDPPLKFGGGQQLTAHRSAPQLVFSWGWYGVPRICFFLTRGSSVAIGGENVV